MAMEIKTNLGKFEVKQGNKPYRIIITYLEGRDNLEKINQFIKELGKFETISNGLNNLTHSIGLTKYIDFGLMHDDFETIGDFKEDTREDRYYIIINSVETDMEKDRKIISEKLIGDMLGNIEKYKLLKKSLEIWTELK